MSRLWQAAESICCQLKRISPPCAETWRWLFPLLGTERAGGPTVLWALAGSGVASTRGQADGLGRCSSKAASWAAGAARVVGLGRPAKWLRGQRWDGQRGRSAQVCRLERQRVVKGKKQVAVAMQLAVSQPLMRCQAIVEPFPWALGHREPPPPGCDLRRGPLSGATGAAPQVLAGLRNLVISLVRRAGHSNVAAALRRHNAHLSEAFDMMGFTYQAGE